VLWVQESGDAKERCSIVRGVEAWSRKARLKKRLVGRWIAIYSPFCGAVSAFIDSDAARGRAQRNNGCLHSTGLA
jgi:hypothetical protein